MKQDRFRKIFQVKWLIISVGILILLTAIWFLVMEQVARTLKSRQAEIRSAVNERLGSSVQFGSLQTGWSGLSLEVTLNEVKGIDRETKLVFLTANQVSLRSTLLQFLFKSGQPFSEILLDGLKMRLKWTDKHEILPLSLEGQPLSSGSDPQTVLQGLASQEKIIIKQGEIDWQGPHTRLLQKIDGTLFWNDVSTLSWQFSGKQQLKISGAEDFLPVAELDLKKEVAANQFKIQMDWAGIKMKALLTSEEISKLECQIDIRNVNLTPFHRNLLLKPEDPEWSRWLLQALEKGTLTDGKIKIQGPIDQLDWQGEATFKQLEVQYSEPWPKINNAKGQVLFSKEKVLVKIASGQLSGALLEVSQVEIAPLGAKEKPSVVVEGRVEGSLENGLAFLQTSPLKESVGNRLAVLHPKGPMTLQLKLNSPLESEKPTQVQGILNVKNADLSIDQIKNSPLRDFSGVFEFTEDGVTGQDVKGNWLEQAVVFEVKPDHIRTRARISLDYLQSQLGTELPSTISGGAEMDLQYRMDKGEWVIESNLKGVAIDLPPPLTKASDSEKQMTLVFYPAVKQEQRYSLTLKDELDAKWVMEIEAEGQQFKRGHLVLGGGKADWMTTNALMVSGELPQLNIDVWKTFLGELGAAPQHLPIQLHLLADEIAAFGINFKNTWISLNHEKTQSEWMLDGPTIKGSIVLPTEKQKVMRLRFDHLKLNLQEIKDQKDSEFFKGTEGAERFPIEFSSKHIELGGTVYGEVGFYLEPKSYGYDIKKLSIRTVDSLLEATGLWRLDNPENGEMSFLQGALSTENISNTFSQWGFSTSMREGQGRIYFNLNWPGSPFQLSLKSAQGGTRLKIRRGRILGVDPGLGKILGLLSFESLTRRLQLDFKDVLRKGFAFDTLDAEIVFKEGHADTQDLKLNGPAANIQMRGEADLLTKALDLQMVVSPNVGSTLPLAAGIATGNPAVGVGVWVIDKLTGSKIFQAPKRYYRVTGTWDAPSIQEVRK